MSHPHLFNDRLLSCEDDEFVLKVDQDIREYLQSAPKRRYVREFEGHRKCTSKLLHKAFENFDIDSQNAST